MPKLSEKFKNLFKSSVWIYPLIIIVAIPTLLIVNTFWNLRSFNRDVNFFIRHEAVSTLDSLKPFILDKIDKPEELNTILTDVVRNNSDFISATILETLDGKRNPVAYSNLEEANLAANLGLNQLATGFNQPFAGLTYDPNLRKNVWQVTVPFGKDKDNSHLFVVKLKTDTVDEVLNRTSRDSIIILIVLVIVILILLANHFLFYKRAIKAQELAEIDKLKDEFISIASHELRTPVTALVGYLELLKGKIPPNLIPTLQVELDTLDMLTKDLGNLINELLDVSRIEQGRLQVKPEETDINEVAKKVIDSLMPQASGKGLKLIFTPNEIPKIMTDPDRVRQVLVNLIGNSVKYTLKGEVKVAIGIKDKFVEINISDTGIGIPPEELPKLFGKFHRVQDKQTQEVRGTGLGLWITKQIVELLGGKIYAQSIYGSGSTFTLTLPLNQNNKV